MNEYTFEILENSTGSQIIKRSNPDGSITWIPADSANSDYQAYLESLNDNSEAE
jgi:hypothetical protein